MASTKETRGTNTMTESLGANQFRKTNFDEPAHEHARLPVPWAPTAAIDTFVMQPENDLLLVDASGHSGSVDLPSAAGLDGVEMTVKQRVGGNTTTVYPFGSELIDDLASFALSDTSDSLTVRAVDNEILTGWVIVAVVSGL